MTSTPPASGPTPTPVKKKDRTGCMTVLLLFGGVAALGAVVLVISLWRAFSTPEGRAFAQGFGEVANLLQDAQLAPGAEEVAKKGGCMQSLVFDVDRMEALSFALAGDAGIKKSGPGRTMVSCQVGFAKAPPACDAIAATYVEAAHPKEPFRVTVQKQGDPGRACDATFDAAGKVITAPQAEAGAGDASALPPTLVLEGGAP